MFLTVCEKCRRVTVQVRRPKWITAGCRGTRARRRCAGRLRVRDRVPREDLVRAGLDVAGELGLSAKQVEQLERRVVDAIADLDRRTILRENLNALYPNAPWYVKRQKLRQIIEESRRSESRRRREAHQLEVAIARARRDEQRVRDRLNRAPHTTGIRRPAHWAPDVFFANRRVNGVMPPDRAPDSAPNARRVRKQLKRPPRAERRDPTCGGFFKPPEAKAHTPSHARRAQLRVDVERDMAIEFEKIRRAGIRRRPGGRAA